MSVKPIAFYLPQFHPTPENDAWWGKGFTEWKNVVRAKPLYHGHRQPRLPTDLGFYDLRVPEVRHQQIELARDHGIHGFCYYFYWFNGTRLLEDPILAHLEDKSSDFPFSLFWANERWSRTWTGKGSEILVDQKYSEQDAHDLADHLIRYFKDPRYIRIDGKPVFTIYYPQDIDIWEKYEKILRAKVAEAGLPGLHLSMVIRYAVKTRHADFNCDSMIEFPATVTPNRRAIGREATGKFGPNFTEPFKGTLLHYRMLMRDKLRQTYPGQRIFRSVMVDFDSTARRGNNALIIPDASPALYAKWLRLAGLDTIARHEPENQFMYIFAWNEWAEGAYLEPDEHYGHKLLEVTKSTVDQLNAAQNATADGQ